LSIQLACVAGKFCSPNRVENCSDKIGIHLNHSRQATAKSVGWQRCEAFRKEPHNAFKQRGFYFSGTA
jgi:hypothetical protein